MISSLQKQYAELEAKIQGKSCLVSCALEFAPWTSLSLRFMIITSSDLFVCHCLEHRDLDTRLTLQVQRKNWRRHDKRMHRALTPSLSSKPRRRLPRRLWRRLNQASNSRRHASASWRRRRNLSRLSVRLSVLRFKRRSKMRKVSLEPMPMPLCGAAISRC